jgi:hypothetical protein
MFLQGLEELFGGSAPIVLYTSGPHEESTDSTAQDAHFVRAASQCQE